jgi:hypothetical protein
MASKKYEELTSEQLTKKDKDATTLLIVLLIFYSISIICLLIFLPLLAVMFIPLYLTVLPLVGVRRQTREELRKRGNIN